MKGLGVWFFRVFSFSQKQLWRPALFFAWLYIAWARQLFRKDWVTNHRGWSVKEWRFGGLFSKMVLRWDHSCLLDTFYQNFAKASFWKQNKIKILFEREILDCDWKPTYFTGFVLLERFFEKLTVVFICSYEVKYGVLLLPVSPKELLISKN